MLSHRTSPQGLPSERLCDTMTNMQWHGMPVVVCKLCLKACEAEAPHVWAEWQKHLNLFNSKWEAWQT